MRNTFLFLFVLFFAQTTYAQVIIGSTTPLANNLVFQVKGNATLADSGDILVVNNEGNMGIGNIAPTSKLDIAKNGSNSPLRIVDGKVYKDAVVGSDDEGYLQWVPMPKSEGQRYYVNDLNAIQTFTYGTYSLLGGKGFKISDTGFYQVVIRWWGATDAAASSMTTSAVFCIAESSTATGNTWSADQNKVRDRAEQYILTRTPSSSGQYGSSTFCFTIALSGQFTANNYLKVYVQTSNAGPWKTGTASTSNTYWLPSLVIFKI